MKHWNLILAMILCLIAIGGLAVLFRTESPDKQDSEQSSIEQPVEDYNDSSTNTTEPVIVDGIELDENRLIF